MYYLIKSVLRLINNAKGLVLFEIKMAQYSNRFIYEV